MSKPKRPSAAERLRLKLEAMGYRFNPAFIQRLRGRDRNANWWQNIPPGTRGEDLWGQTFCSWYTVAQLAKDGVEIEVINDSGWKHIYIKKVDKQ